MNDHQTYARLRDKGLVRIGDTRQRELTTAGREFLAELKMLNELAAPDEQLVGGMMSRQPRGGGRQESSRRA